jgi:hypothetical protein
VQGVNFLGRKNTLRDFLPFQAGFETLDVDSNLSIVRNGKNSQSVGMGHIEA